MQDLLFELLLRRLSPLLLLVDPLQAGIDQRHVGEQQLGVDPGAVPLGVDRTGRVEDIRRFEGADQDAEQVAAPGRVHPLARSAPLGDVGAEHELVFGVGGLFRVVKIGQGVDPLVVDRRDPLDGIFRLAGRWYLAAGE